MDEASLRQTFKYSDYAYESIANRNNVMDYMSVYPDSLRASLGTDVYCGMFQFTSTFKDHVEKKGSVSGYQGEHFAYFFPLDIDSPTGDLDDAKAKTITLLQYLESSGVKNEDMYIYFSGSKGFHILLPHVLFSYGPSAKLNQTFKRMAMILSKASGVPLFSEEEAGIDLIYDRTRLFRLPNTIHSKTGLYKTQLTFKDLKTLSSDQIRERAKEYIGTIHKPIVNNTNHNLKDIFMQAQVNEASQRASVIPSNAMNTSSSERRIKNGKVCIARLLEGVGKGQRDDVAVRLADHFRKQGLSQELTTSTLIAWNQKNDPPMSIQEIETKVNSAWSCDMDYGCHDHILAAHCSNTCFLYSMLVKNKNTEEPEILESNLKTRKDVMRSFVDRFFEARGIRLGIPSLDVHLKLHGGHVVQYMAKSGGGKTSFAMHLMNNLSSQNIPSLFLSLEMSDADVAERSFQIASNSTSAVLERMITDYVKIGLSREEMTESLINRMGEAFSSVITADEDSATVETIERYIHKAKEAFDVKVVFVDYLGRVSQTSSSSYEHVSQLAKELKSMAKRHDVVIFYLHQVNRAIEDATSAVDMSSGRDSGQTEEAADVVLGSWRPGLEEGLKEFVVSILKNRRGASNIRAHLEFVPETMQFKEITDGYESRL